MSRDPFRGDINRMNSVSHSVALWRVSVYRKIPYIVMLMQVEN